MRKKWCPDLEVCYSIDFLSTQKPPYIHLIEISLPTAKCTCS